VCGGPAPSTNATGGTATPSSREESPQTHARDDSLQPVDKVQARATAITAPGGLLGHRDSAGGEALPAGHTLGPAGALHSRAGLVAAQTASARPARGTRRQSGCPHAASRRASGVTERLRSPT